MDKNKTNAGSDGGGCGHDFNIEYQKKVLKICLFFFLDSKNIKLRDNRQWTEKDWGQN